MRKVNLIVVPVLILLNIINVNKIFAQQDTTKASDFNLNIGADIMSRYVWRGTQFGGNSPSIQPAITLNYKNLELGAWGAYSTGGVHASQEMDLYLSYTFLNEMFTVIATNYFFPSDTAQYDYYGYDSKTGHVVETGFIFNGTKKIPLTFSAYVNVYGADASAIGSNPNDTVNFNKKTGIQYSNYFEMGYSHALNNVDFNLFLGFTLNNPKSSNKNTGYIGETGWYGSGPGVVNVGITASKEIKITDNYSLPISVSFITNPQAKKVFLVFGLSF